MSKTDVHTRHCCIRHGCKYGDENCTVTNGTLPQEYPCEMCEEEFHPTYAAKRPVLSELLELEDGLKNRRSFTGDASLDTGKEMAWTGVAEEIGKIVRKHMNKIRPD